MNTDPPDRDWIRLSHAARVTGLSEHLLLAGIAAGRIPLRTLPVGAGTERQTTFVNSADLARWRAAARSPLGAAA